ncbi:MAG: hypothetical protein H6Q14_2290 [Bacteroidetes bacterium]|nr:hypothetical protein [Bacteroidota bacterium]
MKKKVLYICSEQAIGMVHFASAIINTMAKSSHVDVLVLYVVDLEDLYGGLIDPDVPTFIYRIPDGRLNRIKYKLYPSKLVNRIRQICNELSIDCVHSLTLDYVLGHFMKKIRTQVNVIYTVHDLYPHLSVSGSIIEDWVKRYIYSQSVRNRSFAQLLVTSSRQQYEQLRKLYPEKKIVYHQFPTLITDSIAQGGCSIPELSGISDYILFFGHVDRYKGVELLYKAYMQSDLLASKYLVIAGKGLIYFERQWGNEDKVIFLNRFIDDHELRALFQQAACVVYPYLTITQSGVLSFAYYFNTPAVVSDLPYFLDNILESRTALSFEQGDVTDLSKKLIYVTDDSFDKLLMKREQEAYYRTYFSPAALLSELESVYTA